ncbi:hypothetical protein [Haloplanus natans]|uniref:hypothetical protein n=1 Tax=Haloplanus natans TaxID=376171 RepID=UPI0006778A0E|nr:hypothetical protein [Haloplanus natans]
MSKSRRDADGEATEFVRPALVRLKLDLEQLEAELYDGFARRRDVLDWMQRLCVRTLGRTRQEFIEDLARQFRGRVDDRRERALLSAMLVPAARERALDAGTVDELRERIYATVLAPAYHRALRHLRKDAGEYIDSAQETTTSGHDPQVQRYIAMRPAVDELDDNQDRVLEAVLDGFDEPGDILEWGRDLELATHGEIPDQFVRRAYVEQSTRRMLLSGARADERARELFAATYLVPAFNRGVRDLVGRAGEQPDEDKDPSTGAHL